MKGNSLVMVCVVVLLSIACTCKSFAQNVEDNIKIKKEVEKLTNEIEKSEAIAIEKKKELETLKKKLEDDLSTVNKKLSSRYWEFGYQILKPSSRIYFDVGDDDAGEIDLFKDGKLGIVLDFASLYYDYKTQGFSIGPCISAGIASVNNEATNDSVVLVFSLGISIEFRELPVGIEFGYIQGFSANESLKGGNRDDGGIYIGINLNKLIEKKTIKF